MQSDVRAVSGNEFTITTTPTGLYRIVSRGAGAPPKITEELFTNIARAKAALERYERANAPTVRKKEIMQAGIERRRAANELPNGELTRTVNSKDKKIAER